MEKINLINSITFILGVCGEFHVSDIGAEPIDYAEGRKFVRFSHTEVTVDADGDEDYIDYEYLDEDTLEEILMLVKEWEAHCDKTQKRCED
jgi:hypothetical protein